MANAMLLNWINFSAALSGLPKKESPLAAPALKKTFGNLVGWYEEFTDLPRKELKGLSRHFAPLVEQVGGKKKNRDMHAVVYCAVEFLHSYLEPLEIVNMSRFASSGKERKGLVSMTAAMAGFHAEKMKSLSTLLDWLEKNDPLFPGATIRHKLACCLSDVSAKYCFDNLRQCIFEPAISWIRTPSAVLSGLEGDDDCCLGSTLSSCSGGTLSCDCVSGNTGCDCKAPNRLCGQNDKLTEVTAAGFADMYCTVLNPLASTAGEHTPSCLVLDRDRSRTNVLDAVRGGANGVLCSTLDPVGGRFLINGSKMPFDLGRLVMKTRDCQQTGFCPPKSGGCGGLC